MEQPKVYVINSKFVFDERELTLRVENECRQVEPLVGSVISFLIRRAPGTVTHAELIAEFWGPNVKSREVMMKTISKARHLFDSEVIQTVNKLGYRWVAMTDDLSSTRSQPAERRTTSGLFTPRTVIIALSLTMAILMVLKSIFLPHHQH